MLKAIVAESVADTDAEREPPHIPTLAWTSNGRTLIAIHYLDGVDITDRETWIGAILSEAEACDVLDKMSDAADDTTAHTGDAIIAKAKKRARKESGEGACRPPSREARVDRLPRTILVRQVAPRRARAQDPQHRFQHEPMRLGIAAASLRFGRQKRLDFRPLDVTEAERANHRSDRSQNLSDGKGFEDTP